MQIKTVINNNGGLAKKAQNYNYNQLPVTVLAALTGRAVTLPKAAIAKLQPHPARKVFSVPNEAPLESLVESICKNGLQNPILLNADSKIIDGELRLKACLATGVTPKFRVLPPEAEPYVLGIILAQNYERRHLDKSQLAMVGAQICISLETEAIQRKLNALQGEPTKSLGKSADRAGQMLRISPTQVKNAKAILETKHANKIWAGEWTVHQALREHRTDLARQRAFEEAAAKPAKPEDIQVLYGDFREVLRNLADNSIDLILTDPPYDGPSLPLWGAMAKLGARVLKPTAKMVGMSGQEFLPEVFQQIAPHPLH